MSLNVNRETFAPLTDLASDVASTISSAADRIAREVAGIVADGAIDGTATSPEAQATEGFEAQFGQLAQDKDEFHALMKQVYGDDYDAATAEQYRQMALRGDYSFLPPVQFVSRETLTGANGAYSEAEGVIYLAEDLKNDPAKMQSVFIEEAGHHLDTLLNETDTIGDEGEMFRRLLSGEKLSSSQIAAIRAESDKGVIYVDGKAVEVEFWLGDIVDAVGDAAKAVGDAVSSAASAVADAVGDAVSEVGNAAGQVVDGIVDTAKLFAEAAHDLTVGVFTNLIQFQFTDAMQSIVDGVDKALFRAPQRLLNAGLNSVEHLLNAPTHLLPDFLGEPVRDVIARGVDMKRTILNTTGEIARSAFRTLHETPIDFLDDLAKAGGHLIKGEFGEAASAFGGAFVNAGVRLVGGVFDVAILTIVGAVDVVATGLWLQPPSRPLTAEEEAVLREMYGDSLDYNSIRVSENNITTKMGIASHAIGNTIYLANYDASDGLNLQERELLVHEVGHVWQNQHGGNDYIHKAVFAMFNATIDAVGWGGLTLEAFEIHRNDAYNWRLGFSQGKSFDELNPEQQAMVIQEIERARDDDGDVTPDDWDPPLTPEEYAFVLAAWAHFRAGRGAP